MSRTSRTKEPQQDKAAAHRLDAAEQADVDCYDRHLVNDHVVSPEHASQRERFEAVARSLRDLLTQRWLLTQQTQDAANPKRVYYLSMEFLIGRTLVNNIINLEAEELVRRDLASDPQMNWTEAVETEPDAGLGNGGLGRLAACFIDSLATLQIPAIGYGLRYEYGIFRQQIEAGRQVEHPDHWLKFPDPWEVVRPRETVQVPLGCAFSLEGGVLRVEPGHATQLLGVPYDRPVVGYGGATINTLRLWTASSPEFFNFGEFNSGDFVGAIVDRVLAETVTRVLYPDDSTKAGQALRFVQEYFLVCCSLADIVARFRAANADWQQLPDKVAIQLNDTHPAMAVAELMRILLDQHHLGWDEAWDLTIRTLAYTNHTLLPEALEKWPVRIFELVCPRLLEIVHEIDRRFLADVRQRYPGDEVRAQRMSLVEEGADRLVRMAHLAIVGTHSTNGVARIHSDLLRTRVVADFADMFPERFNNKTNGVTPRRWLMLANPDLTRLITAAIGDDWVADLSQLRRLLPSADDANFRAKFLQAKQSAKERFAAWLKEQTGQVVDPQSIFDSQIKRIHEYKRQLLNALHIVVLYNRLRANPSLAIPPRTFFFAGKAAPAYRLAKLIIKFINNVAGVIEADPLVRDRIRVVFLPNYNVSLAERLIPATDVSEQISTAGYEASGTGNMKFMMNGALTIGTRDGATIEMAEEAGEENFFLFGLTAEEVAGSRGWYSPQWHYENEPETRQALDLIFNNHFSPDEPGIFEPLRDTLLTKGDYFMHLADLTSYGQAQQRVSELYADRQAWVRMAITNVACSGKFSSDRAIAEYAADIWNAEPCPVPELDNGKQPRAHPEGSRQVNPSNAAGPVLISDFDGTMTRHDFYKLAIERLLPPETPDYWAEYRSGEITHFEALRRYFAAIRKSADEALEVVRQMELDPGLSASIHLLRQSGWDVIITSAGCEWYIRQLLSSAGVDVAVYANPGRFEAGQGLLMEMPTGSPYLSATLGVDKTAVVRNYVAQGGTVAFAGDGFPDADAARVVPGSLRFARGDLAEVLRQERLDFQPYESWSDIPRTLLRQRG